MSPLVPLAELPVPSTSLLSNVMFEDPGGEVLLRFEFDRDGTPYRGGFLLDRARAFRFTAESHCTAWQIKAYDTLVEVVESDWVAELSAQDARWDMRHFMIYIDGPGCYEIVAATWSWLPEERLPAGP